MTFLTYLWNILFPPAKVATPDPVAPKVQDALDMHRRASANLAATVAELLAENERLRGAK